MKISSARQVSALLILMIGICSTHKLFASDFPDSVYKQLDYGFYFFGKDGVYQKFDNATNNAYFDSQKSTVIYIHGWQNNNTPRRFRETFDSNFIPGAPGNTDLASGWVDQGYNIAIFYWNQFADEQEVKDAEAKLWVSNGPKGMRWRSSDGNYHDFPEQQKSVVELFADQYMDVFRDYQGEEIRLSGHSLGGQAAVIAAHELRERFYNGLIPPEILPKRIALLDAAFLQDGRAYLDGAWPGERARDYIAALKRDGTLVEAYRSSGVTSNPLIGDSNDGLLKQTAFAEIRPWYFNIFQLPEKHQVARWWYFDSINHVSPQLENSSNPGMSATTSDVWLRYWMDSRFRLIQTEGRRTKRLNDDEFTVWWR